SAKPGVKKVRFITMRTNLFEPHPAAVARDRIRQIPALTLRANHNGNQSQLSCIARQFRQAELSVQSEGSTQCIVPGYAKSKLYCYKTDACRTRRVALPASPGHRLHSTKRSYGAPKPPRVSAEPAYRTCEP